MGRIFVVVSIMVCILVACARPREMKGPVVGFLLTATRYEILEIATQTGSSTVLWSGEKEGIFGLASPSYSAANNMAVMEKSDSFGKGGLFFFDFGEMKPALFLPQDGPYLFPSWRPDGKAVAVQSRVTPLDQEEKWRVQVLNLDGSILWTAEAESGGGRIDWSPDGGSILYSGADGRIVACNVKSETCTSWLEGSSPVFSPDGKVVAYVKESSICSAPLAYGKAERCVKLDWLTSPIYLAAWDSEINCIVAGVKKIVGFAERNYAYCVDIANKRELFLAELPTDMGFFWSRTPAWRETVGGIPSGGNADP